MWSMKVRSGHNICCLCSFLVEFSSCRVTYENSCKSSVFYLARRSLCKIINSTLGMSFIDGCHRWGALYFAPASNSRVNTERVVRLSLCTFRKWVQKWGYVCLFRKKLSNFESRLCLPALISDNLWKGILFWPDYRRDLVIWIFPDFPAIKIPFQQHTIWPFLWCVHFTAH